MGKATMGPIAIIVIALALLAWIEISAAVELVNRIGDALNAAATGGQ